MLPETALALDFFSVAVAAAASCVADVSAAVLVGTASPVTFEEALAISNKICGLRAEVDDASALEDVDVSEVSSDEVVDD